MKRKLLGIANAAISPLGIQIYKSGMDMESAIRQIGRRASDVRTVIDIGASDGRWSRSAMEYFPKSKFIAVDPLVEREAKLKQLKAVNPLFDYVLCVAGEKESDSVSLTVGDDLDGSTVGGNQGVVRTVPSHSIDAIVQMKQCSGPYVLKFDTHGFEVPILNGAANILPETHYIVMEVYNYRHTGGTLLFYEMCALLDTLGFRCFNMADPMHRPLDGCLWQMDLLFARKDNEVFRENGYGKA
jgi:FkbM family methyltransferase